MNCERYSSILEYYNNDEHLRTRKLSSFDPTRLQVLVDSQCVGACALFARTVSLRKLGTVVGVGVVGVGGFAVCWCMCAVCEDSFTQKARDSGRCWCCWCWWIRSVLVHVRCLRGQFHSESSGQWSVLVLLVLVDSQCVGACALFARTVSLRKLGTVV